MTLNDYINKIANYSKFIERELEQNILDETAEALRKSMRTRIFTKGLNSSNQIVAEKYSEKPMIAAKEMFVKKSAFKGDKTMKLKGYKELREIQGLKTDHVHLEYTGELRESLTTERVGKNIFVGFRTKRGREVASKLERKYKQQIFNATDEEIKRNLQRVSRDLKNLQKRYFYA